MTNDANGHKILWKVTMVILFSMISWLGVFFRNEVRVQTPKGFSVLFVDSITLILVAFMYWKMLLQARKHRQNIFAERSIARNQTELTLSSNRKAEKSVGCVLGFMLLCNLPSVLYLVYSTIFGYNLFGISVFSSWAELFHFVNASFNPFVYCWRNRSIHKAMLNITTSKN